MGSIIVVAAQLSETHVEKNVTCNMTKLLICQAVLNSCQICTKSLCGSDVTSWVALHHATAGTNPFQHGVALIKINCSLELPHTAFQLPQSLSCRCGSSASSSRTELDGSLSQAEPSGPWPATASQPKNQQPESLACTLSLFLLKIFKPAMHMPAGCSTCDAARPA